MTFLKDFFQEFKKFAMRGNVVDMAVGIIIGVAFSKIVTSAVTDVIMPPIGLAIGGVDFSNLAITLKKAEGTVAAVTLNYGRFLQTIIDFIIVAFAIFLLIKGMNFLMKREEKSEDKPAEKPEEVKLLTEIRDLLQQRDPK